MVTKLSKSDPVIFKLIEQEKKRQQDKLSLIPSENFFSPAVREAVGSVFSHKYSEGNIGARYYEGNEFVDEMETVAKKRAAKLFRIPDGWDVNVQALAGSNANLAVYLAVLKPGDLIMSMYLPDGGHLSHGWSYEPKKASPESERLYLGGSRKVNITTWLFKSAQYKTDPKTHLFDFDEIERLVMKHKPKLLITGGTAYPRDMEYKRMAEIAKKAGAMYMADIAHEAGLIAAGVLKSPVGVADIVTMTTHKTLRSGRGAVILAHKDLIKKINKGVLPGLQGGPFNNNIAGIAVGLGEALKPGFKVYAKQVVKNAKVLAKELTANGFQLVTGGTDKHLILIDMTGEGMGGKYPARALNYAGLVMNMNTMPGETQSPANPSALRLGTPFVTTRGLKEKHMKSIADWVRRAVDITKGYLQFDFEDFDEKIRKDPEIMKISREVKHLCEKFPLDF